MVHMSVQQYSLDFFRIYKRNNFSTPKNYLDFIKNYIGFLRDKRTLYDNNVRRLEGGLTTLKKAQEDTEVLSLELAEKNKDIAKKSAEVTVMIAEIKVKSDDAAIKAKAAGEKKTQLDADGIVIAREEKEASIALEAAVPALEAAKSALANIQKKDLDEIKALANPPQAIYDVCTICFFLYPKDKQYDKVAKPEWTQIKNAVLSET